MTIKTTDLPPKLSISLFFFSAILFSVTGKEISLETPLRVGIYQNRPKIFTNNKGDPDGIFIDILKDIAFKENLKLEYVTGNWSDLINQLAQGEIDILPDMAYTPKRDSLFNFNQLSVINTWLEVYTTPSNRIHSLSEMQHMRIGVLKDSYQEELLNNKIRTDFNLTYEVVPYEDYKSTKYSLKNRDVDLIVADRFFYFSSEFDSTIAPTGIVFQPNELYFGFSNHIPLEVLNIYDGSITNL